MAAAEDFVLWGGMYGEDSVIERAHDFSITQAGFSDDGDYRSQYTTRIPDFLSQTRLDHSKYGQSPRRDARKNPRSIYESLTDPFAIRVLELFAGDFDDELQGTLLGCSVEFEDYLKALLPENEAAVVRTNFVVSLDDGRPVWFTALSYTWGSPDTDERWRIVCNGQVLHLTENLNSALRYLRRTHGNAMLWIDQICIDQSDIEEKSQQVALMENVYRVARNTVAWIGERQDGSDTAIQTLRDVNAAVHTRSSQENVSPADLADLSLPEPLSPRWPELYDFFARPWWGRCWIMQEVALSYRVHIMCGPDVVSWQEVGMFSIIAIKDGILRYLNGAVPIAIGGSRRSGCERVYDIDSFTGQTLPNSLLFALGYGRDAAATLGRDKVYELMAMCQDRLKPDYSKGVKDEDVFFEVALKELSPKLLYCVDHDQPSASSPSWVPHWSSPRKTQSLGYLSMTEAVHNAANRTAPGFQLVESTKELRVQGRIFQAIDKLFDPCASQQSNPRQLGIVPEFEKVSPLTWDFLASYRAFALADNVSGSGSNPFNAAWMTIVAGSNDTAFQQAPSEYGGIFGLLFDKAIGTSPSFPNQPTPKRALTSLDQLKSRRPGQWYRQICAAATRVLANRRICKTTGGYLGVAPRGTQAGDLVAVIFGGHVPFVIRQHTDTAYKLVGECYIHGIMKGEVMDMADVHDEEITLA